jgi:Flp pilus assembly protein CpaB
LLGLAVVTTLFGGSDAAPAARADGNVLVLTRAVAAGGAIDPVDLRSVALPAALVPRGALVRVEDAAFREAVVALPPGLALVPALLRRPGATAPALGAGDRAVGVRVDDVTGLPGLLRAGSRVDVLVAVRGDAAVGVEAVARDVEVLAQPARPETGEGWAVVLRLPVTTAEAVAAAQSDGRQVRLLGREAGS